MEKTIKKFQFVFLVAGVFFVLAFIVSGVIDVISTPITAAV